MAKMKRTIYKTAILLEVEYEEGKEPTIEQIAKAAEGSVSLDIATDASENEVHENAWIKSVEVDWDELHKLWGNFI